MGRAFKMENAKGDELTPDKALELLRLNNYKAQRAIRKTNLDELIESIIAGIWRSAEVSIAIMPNGEEVIVNGQHTLEACIQADRNIFVFMVWYKVSCKKGLAVLYQTFDFGKGARTIGDAVKAELHANNLDWPLHISSLICSALGWIEGEFGYYKHGKASKARLISKNISDGLFILSIFKGATKEFKHLKRGPVMAAMIKTYRERPEDAAQFWQEVQSGKGAGTGSQSLRTYLMGKPDTVHRKALYEKCMTSFDHWYSL